MSHGRSRLVSTLVLALMLALVGTLAYAQGGSTTSTLSGTVVDSSAGVIPGADVVAKNNATAAESRAVSDSEGRFTIPALEPGTYTVTVSLMGFKTWTAPDVKLVAATPLTVKAVLEVGKLEETVIVQGAAEVVQTQTAAVTTTLSTQQINSTPLVTRNTLDFVTALPGVNTTGSMRNSSIMGLQPSAINITIDGVNVQDNFYKSDSGNAFFTRINPRMDAIEEVSVSTANPGAESAGQGAVSIRFQTRQGTNKFTGSAYWYNRDPRYNSNYWFNEQQKLPKDQIKVNTFGVRQGGPIVKDKLFFFFNYEEFRQPGSQSRTRTILTPEAAQGLFTWSGGTKNLLTLAAANNQVSTIDPVIGKLLADVQNSTSQGTVSASGVPITRYFSFTNEYAQTRRFPTTRVDYNVTPRHRIGISNYVQIFRSMPDTLNSFDPIYPGFPGAAGQNSNRWSFMGNWRWTITSNMVSEVRGGVNGGPSQFAAGVAKDTFKSGGIGDMNGYAINTSFGNGDTLMTSPYTTRNPNERDAPTYVLEDTISWIKGKHGINIGASFTEIGLNYVNHYMAPILYFGVETQDPAASMFSTANFPGASSTELNNARNLYALLTGRITSINSSAYLNGDTGQYVYNGDATQKASQRELGFYAQDSWRINPALTLNYGLRYELQLPFVMTNAYYSRPLDYANTYGVSGLDGNGNPNLFQPGIMTGSPTQLRGFKKGEAAYNTDLNNVGPSVGLAWKPSVKADWMKKILGEDPVLRGGYSKAFTREGIMAVSSLYGANPGGSVTANRNMSLGTLLLNGQTLPVLFRSADLSAPPFAATPSYPLTPTTSNSVNEFYPDAATPYAHSFNLSFQRALSKNMAVDIRYVGTRNYGGWWIGGRNMNEYNVVENGFLNEFKLAQANLAANIAAGKGATFAYTGAAGTAPLPIFQAWLGGTDSSFYKSSTYVNYLAKYNPNPTSMAAALQTSNSAYAKNAAAAGLPANFFIVNPSVSSGGAWVTGRPEDERKNRYDAMQIELRRRMSGGFLVQGSYQWVARSQSTNFYTLRMPGEYVDAGVPHHVVKANWVWELPFGQGRKFGGNVTRGMNRLVGGWSFDGQVRIQSGNILDFGNFRLVGMTDAELQKVFNLRFQQDASGMTRVYMLPQDIIDNTIKAFAVSATDPSGYSKGVPQGRYFAPVSGPDCINGYTGQCTGGHPLHHYVTGPNFFRADMSVGKRIDITSRVYANVRLEVMNVFNNIDFVGLTMVSPYTNLGNYEVSTTNLTNPAYRDISNSQDPGGRLMQLVFRVSW